MDPDQILQGYSNIKLKIEAELQLQMMCRYASPQTKTVFCHFLS